jgi:hypothetical protein
MTRTRTGIKATIRSVLEATVFTGAIAVLPVAALAETGPTAAGDGATERVPDHAAAEARSTSGASATEATEGVPDHAAAEARSAGDKAGSSGTETGAGVPDHATAEARGAAGQTPE